jgi:hypothetical protein
MSKSKQVPGSLLITAISAEMCKRKQTQSDTAVLLGCSKPYLAALLGGDRPLSGLGKDKIDAIARYLHIPAMQVRTMSEQIHVDEFFCERTVEQEIDQAYQRILSDSLWCTFAPPVEQWAEMTLEAKRLIALLYERVKHEDFLTKAIPFRVVDA